MKRGCINVRNGIPFALRGAWGLRQRRKSNTAALNICGKFHLVVVVVVAVFAERSQVEHSVDSGDVRVRHIMRSG